MQESATGVKSLSGWKTSGGIFPFLTLKLPTGALWILEAMYNSFGHVTQAHLLRGLKADTLEQDPKQKKALLQVPTFIKAIPPREL